jgi:hypothetical protein
MQEKRKRIVGHARPSSAKGKNVTSFDPAILGCTWGNPQMADQKLLKPSQKLGRETREDSRQTWSKIGRVPPVALAVPYSESEGLVTRDASK